jgi:hypothetical protein
MKYLTHLQVILRYKDNSVRIEPYTLVIMEIVLLLFIAYIEDNNFRLYKRA